MAQSEGLRFSRTHEWARAEGDVATVGVSQHAVDELGDVALVLLPPVGRVLAAGESFGEIESLKAVSDLYAPVGGTVAEINTTLVDAPELAHDAHGVGWLIRIRMSDPSDMDALMDTAAYDAFIQEG